MDVDEMDVDEIDEIMDMLDAKEISKGVYEKRKANRKPVELDIAIITKNREGSFVEDIKHSGTKSKIVDVSTSGAGVESNATLYKGDVFFCETIDGPLYIKAELKVMHHRKTKNGFHYGCRFVEIIESKRN